MLLLCSMFTGIIEATGKVERIIKEGSNATFWISSPISHELKIDQSISHEGICLTVEAIDDNMHRVTAIDETLKKTNLGNWQTGQIVNLERCMVMNGRLDGHIVQGHVDTTAVCIAKKELDGSWEFTFEFDAAHAPLVIEKGSVAINGTSLTCFNVSKNRFTVAIIPYTYHHTSIQSVQKDTVVNIEFDMIGKYIHHFLELRNA